LARAGVAKFAEGNNIGGDNAAPAISLPSPVS
jgi:hypothetical protein